MSYCTLQQLADRYGRSTLVQVSDRGDEATGEVDEAMIERVIADACATIDGYLKGRYALPLASVPAMVTDLALSIAIYKAHAHVAPEKITRDHGEAMKALRDLATGVVRLDVEGAEPASSGSSDVWMNDPERPLSAATMKGYI